METEKEREKGALNFDVEDGTDDFDEEGSGILFFNYKYCFHIHILRYISEYVIYCYFQLIVIKSRWFCRRFSRTVV